MKTKSKTIRIAFWILVGIAILVSSLALNRPSPPPKDATATPASQAGTLTAEASIQEDVGSTDLIMVIAVLIVLIVIIPILLKRQAWANGKRM